MIITFISDTHNKHKYISPDLPGGDILLHAGDISSRGYEHEIREFCKWFNSMKGYKNKIFIAGNHDWGFLDYPEKMKEILDFYKSIVYLQDNLHCLGEEHEDYNKMIKIWGSPWQPEFFNWAFNLPRNSPELEEKWSLIPEGVDILITHGPAYGYLDRVKGINMSGPLGCEVLTERIKKIKPKIHVCGHIHSGYGYSFDGDTHYINASVLGENYQYVNRPITVDWDPVENSLIFL